MGYILAVKLQEKDIARCHCHVKGINRTRAYRTLKQAMAYGCRLKAAGYFAWIEGSLKLPFAKL